jgi:hypothetical protein
MHSGPGCDRADTGPRPCQRRAAANAAGGQVAEDIQVNVLGPVELVVDDKRTPLGGRPVLSKVLALLALGQEAGVPAERLIGVVWPGETEEGKLEAAVSRLRQLGLGDRLPKKQGDRYRLDLGPDQVDARRLRATAKALDGTSPPSDAELDAALASWRGEPAQDTDLAARFGEGARTARQRLLDERRRRARPRILILDDKVGEKIANLLGDYACTVLTKIEEFWPYADRLDEHFDAALVDLHLSEDDIGAEGLAAVDALRLHSSVPTVLMTFRPQEGSLDQLMQRYNLFEFFVKSGNTASADFSQLRVLVAKMLSDGTPRVLLERLHEDLGRCERRAALCIRTRDGLSTAKAHMERDVDRIRSLIRDGGELTSVRAQLTAFTRHWLPEDI